MITVEKWEDYQVEELKNQQQINNKATTNQHKQECKEIYFNLFNKYKKELVSKNFGEKIKIIGQCKAEQDYLKLNEDEQERLFNELMSSNNL